MNHFVRVLVLLVLTGPTGFLLAQPAGNYVLHAPGGLSQCLVTVSAGKLYYSVTHGPDTIIRRSPLVLHTNEFNPADTLELFGVDSSRHDSYWEPVYGERSRYRDHYREMILSLRRKQKPGQYFQLAVRAYDEGIAFRYVFPENLSLQVLDILREESWFTFPAGTRAWFTPLAQGEYQLLPLESWTATSERPLTLQLPGGKYAALAEAGMVNYARMKLRLAGADAVVSELSGPVTESSPFATPWRVVMVAGSPGKLLENNYLLLNLNQPAALENTGWIRPGKVIRALRLSTEGAKKYVDIAVKSTYSTFTSTPAGTATSTKWLPTLPPYR
jgi:alpha-glucosidase